MLGVIIVTLVILTGIIIAMTIPTIASILNFAKSWVRTGASGFSCHVGLVCALALLKWLHCVLQMGFWGLLGGSGGLIKQAHNPDNLLTKFP